MILAPNFVPSEETKKRRNTWTTERWKERIIKNINKNKTDKTEK